MNAVHFVDTILSNNSTDDHINEFITQGGLKPLVKLLALPVLPLDYPNSNACLAVTGCCRSILVSPMEYDSAYKGVGPGDYGEHNILANIDMQVHLVSYVLRVSYRDFLNLFILGGWGGGGGGGGVHTCKYV